MTLDNSQITRENILTDIKNLLNYYGYKTSDIYDRSCFDILARKDNILIILKILVNIDSLTSSQAEELSKIAGTFLASPIIIGMKSKQNYLEEDVVYERYEIPSISPQTLCNIVVNGIHPEVLAKRGGYYVRINGGLLRQLREEKNMSLKELADLSHVSRETIYKYEQGNSQTYPETAMKIEEVLETPITLSMNLLENEKLNDSLDNRILEPAELIKLGYDIKSSSKTPFDAISENSENSRELLKLKDKLMNKLDEIEKIRAEINKKTGENHILLTNMERGRSQKVLKNIAQKTRDISEVTGYDSLFVLEKEQNQDFIEKVPAVYTWELKDLENISELLKIIKERKDEAEES